jgi:predicted nucleic acid-binding Zn ribbon protein
MATYIYRDPITGDTREVIHGMTESPEIVNEATGNRMERVITGGAGFVFKGDGFYITENRSASYKAGEKAESATAPAAAPACGTGGCGACAA